MKNRKLKGYILLNFQQIKGEMLYIGAMGIAFALARLFTHIDLDLEETVVTMTIASIAVFYKICSKMLYEDEAYLYQSFPISPAETVIAKIIVPAVTMIVFAVGSSLTKPSLLMWLPIGMLVALCISGLVLLAIQICWLYDNGENAELNRFKTAILAIVLMVINFFVLKNIITSQVLGQHRLAILAIFLIAETLALVNANVRMLKKYYKI